VQHENAVRAHASMAGLRPLPRGRRQMPFPRINLDRESCVRPPYVGLREKDRADLQARVIHRRGQAAILDQLPQVTLRNRGDPVRDFLECRMQRARTLPGPSS
jgi:hypothetical protein